jgi:hypothetical protein
MAEAPNNTETLIDGLPEISDEDLAALNDVGNDVDLGNQGAPPVEDAEEILDKPKDITEPPKVDKPKEDEDDENKEDYVPGSQLKRFAEANKMTFNEDQLPEELTLEQEMELLAGMSQKLVTDVRGSVQQADVLAKLYQEDPEVQELLQARAAGKSLKDFIAEAASAPLYTDPDTLVAKYLKEENLFSDEEINEEIASLKEHGKFDAKAEVVTSFYTKKQEAQDAIAAQEYQQSLDDEADAIVRQQQNYAGYLQGTPKMGEFVLSNDIRAELFDHATLLDENRVTPLEHDLQSDENVLKASIAIKYWDMFVSGLRNVSKSNSTQEVIDALTETDPAKLQSSSRRNNSQDEVNDEALDGF